MTPPPVIEVDGLRKRHGSVQAVDGVSLAVPRGEIFGVLGPNGAGKTTTVECLMGLQRPDDGRVRVLGLDPHREGRALRRRIGAQLQHAALNPFLRVREAVRLFAAYYDHPADGDALLAEWGLAGRAHAAFESLSGGERQRLFLVLALIGRPEVVFLDELTSGLDPQARRAAYELVARVRDAGATVVLVTHLLEEAERLCDRVAVLRAGRIVALGAPAALTHPGASLEDAYLDLVEASA